jgi:RecB family endonuclease NucS
MSGLQHPRSLRQAVVQHRARLDILCCLDPGQPLAIEQVADETGMQERLAKHHMRILEAFGLVAARRTADSGPILYVLCLDDKPAWVSVVVEAHRPADRSRRA